MKVVGGVMIAAGFAFVFLAPELHTGNMLADVLGLRVVGIAVMIIGMVLASPSTKTSK